MNKITLVPGPAGIGRRAVGVAAAGELVVMDPILLIGYLIAGIKNAGFDGSRANHHQTTQQAQGQEEKETACFAP